MRQQFPAPAADPGTDVLRDAPRENAGTAAAQPPLRKLTRAELEAAILRVLGNSALEEAEALNEGTVRRRKRLAAVARLTLDSITDSRRGEPGRGRYLLFTSSGIRFAAALHQCREAVRTASCSPLPGTPHWVRGVCNLRGHIVSVVDLPAFLTGRHSTTSAQDTHRLLVVHGQHEWSTALIVESIDGIRHWPNPTWKTSGNASSASSADLHTSDDAAEDAEAVADWTRRFCCGCVDTGESLVHVLDVPRLLAPDGLGTLAARATAPAPSRPRGSDH